MIDLQVNAPEGWRVVIGTTHIGETRGPLFGPTGDAPLTVGGHPGAVVTSGSVSSGINVDNVRHRD